MVPMEVVDQLRVSYKRSRKPVFILPVPQAETKELKQQLAQRPAAAVAASEAAINGDAGASEERIMFYRQQLLLAVQGRLSPQVRKALEHMIASASDDGASAAATGAEAALAAPASSATAAVQLPPPPPPPPSQPTVTSPSRQYGDLL